MGGGVCGSKAKSHQAPSPSLCCDDSDRLTVTASHGPSLARPGAWTVCPTFRECQILIMKYFWARTVQKRYKHLNIPQLLVVNTTHY